jgi:hypothetical protein
MLSVLPAIKASVGNDPNQIQRPSDQNREAQGTKQYEESPCDHLYERRLAVLRLGKIGHLGSHPGQN